MSNNISRIFDFAYHQLANFPNEKCFNYKKDDSWKSISTQQFIADEWSIEAGHLTPTMKMKRKIIKEKYNNLHQKIYNQ